MSSDLLLDQNLYVSVPEKLLDQINIIIQTQVYQLIVDIDSWMPDGNGSYIIEFELQLRGIQSSRGLITYNCQDQTYTVEDDSGSPEIAVAIKDCLNEEVCNGETRSETPVSSFQINTDIIKKFLSENKVSSYTYMVNLVLRKLRNWQSGLRISRLKGHPDIFELIEDSIRIYFIVRNGIIIPVHFGKSYSYIGDEEAEQLRELAVRISSELINEQ
jgi:hypothetical protein